MVVTYNALPWLEHCRERRRYETVVVDNGSTDGTVELVRERFPDVRVIEQENRRPRRRLERGHRARRPALRPVPERRRVGVGDAVERLAAFADEHPRRRGRRAAAAQPRRTLQPSVRGFPTLWRLATEYLFLRKLAPRSRALNAFYAGGFDHDERARGGVRDGRRACSSGARRSTQVGPARRGLLPVQRGDRLVLPLPAGRAGRCSSSPARSSCTSAAPRTAAGCSARTSAATCASSRSTAARGGRAGAPAAARRAAAARRRLPRRARPHVPRRGALARVGLGRRCSAMSRVRLRAIPRAGRALAALALVARFCPTTGARALPRGSRPPRSVCCSPGRSSRGRSGCRAVGRRSRGALAGAHRRAWRVVFAVHGSLWPRARPATRRVGAGRAPVAPDSGSRREAVAGCARSSLAGASCSASRSGTSRGQLDGDALFHLARVRKLDAFGSTSSLRTRRRVRGRRAASRLRVPALARLPRARREARRRRPGARRSCTRRACSCPSRSSSPTRRARRSSARRGAALAALLAPGRARRARAGTRRRLPVARAAGDRGAAAARARRCSRSSSSSSRARVCARRRVARRGLARRSRSSTRPTRSSSAFPLGGCVVARACSPAARLAACAVGLAAVARPGRRRVALAAADRPRHRLARPVRRESCAARLAHYARASSTSSRRTELPRSRRRCSPHAAPSPSPRSSLVPLAALACRRRWAAFVLGGSVAVLALMLVPPLFTTSPTPSRSRSRAAPPASCPFAVRVRGRAAVLARLLARAGSSRSRSPRASRSSSRTRATSATRSTRAARRSRPGSPRSAARPALVAAAVRADEGGGATRGPHRAGGVLFVLPVAISRLRALERAAEPQVDAHAGPRLGAARARPARSRRLLATTRRATGSPRRSPSTSQRVAPGHVADTKENHPYARRDDANRFLATGDLSIPRRYGARWIVVDSARGGQPAPQPAARVPRLPATFSTACRGRTAGSEATPRALLPPSRPSAVRGRSSGAIPLDRPRTLLPAASARASGNPGGQRAVGFCARRISWAFSRSITCFGFGV